MDKSLVQRPLKINSLSSSVTSGRRTSQRRFISCNGASWLKVNVKSKELNPAPCHGTLCPSKAPQAEPKKVEPVLGARAVHMLEICKFLQRDCGGRRARHRVGGCRGNSVVNLEEAISLRRRDVSGIEANSRPHRQGPEQSTSWKRSPLQGAWATYALCVAGMFWSRRNRLVFITTIPDLQG